MTALAWVSLIDGKVDKAGFLPCMLNKKGQVYPLDAASPEGKLVGDYILKGSNSQGFKTALSTDGAPAFGDYRAFNMVKSESVVLRQTGS